MVAMGDQSCINTALQTLMALVILQKCLGNSSGHEKS